MELYSIKNHIIIRDSNHAAYLCLIDQNSEYWFYLFPIFKNTKVVNKLVKKYSNYRFRKKAEFEKFSVGAFPKISKTAIFMHRDDFALIAATENAESILELFKQENLLTVENKEISAVNVENTFYIMELHFSKNGYNQRIGKIGISKTISRRLNEIKTQYQADHCDLLFAEKLVSARTIETNLKKFLNEKKALKEIKTKTGSLSTETFDCSRVSITEVIERTKKFINEQKQVEANLDQAKLAELVKLSQNRFQNDPTFAIQLSLKWREVLLDRYLKTLSVDEQKKFLEYEVRKFTPGFNSLTELPGKTLINFENQSDETEI